MQPFAADRGAPPNYSDVSMLLTWSASDPSYICFLEVATVHVDGSVSPLPLDRYDASAMVVHVTDYDAPFGDTGNLVSGWKITAYDCAGNVAERLVRHNLRVMQEDALRYRGAWSRSTCECWLGGSMQTRRTWEDGATASFTYTSSGQYMALVMPMAANRGQVDVLVDGARRATIDAGARGFKPRSVVWQTWMAAGQHTVTLVARGTSNRARIDLDAILFG